MKMKLFLVFVGFSFMASGLAQDGLVEPVGVDQKQDEESLIQDRSATTKRGLNSLHGDWVFFGSGLTGDIPGSPTASMAIYSFSEEGECSCTRMENGSFGVMPWTAATECSYIINPDGTGSISITIEEDTIPFAFVLPKRGSELYWMRLDDVVTSGTAKKVAGPMDLMKK